MDSEKLKYSELPQSVLEVWKAQYNERSELIQMSGGFTEWACKTYDIIDDREELINQESEDSK